VLDTSVMVAGGRSPDGASRRLIELGLGKCFDWLVSVPLMLEYETVLCREEHLMACGRTASEVNRFLDIVLVHATRVLLREHRSMHLPDPDDKHVLELALDGSADAVVTHNTRHFASPLHRFGVNLYTPGQALRILGGNDE